MYQFEVIPYEDKFLIVVRNYGLYWCARYAYDSHAHAQHFMEMCQRDEAGFNLTTLHVNFFLECFEITIGSRNDSRQSFHVHLGPHREAHNDQTPAWVLAAREIMGRAS